MKTQPVRGAAARLGRSATVALAVLAASLACSAMARASDVPVHYDAFDNVAAGPNPFQSIRTDQGAVDNVVAGFVPMSALTSGDSNVAVGNAALQSDSVGSENVALGTSA